MKLLLDENLSRRLVPFLLETYPESSQVALLGMQQASDLEVWRYAGEHGYVLVTHDADFYDLSLTRGAPPLVLWRFFTCPHIHASRTCSYSRFPCFTF